MQWIWTYKNRSKLQLNQPTDVPDSVCMRNSNSFSVGPVFIFSISLFNPFLLKVLLHSFQTKHPASKTVCVFNNSIQHGHSHRSSWRKIMLLTVSKMCVNSIPFNLATAMETHERNNEVGDWLTRIKCVKNRVMIGAHWSPWHKFCDKPCSQ